MRRWTLGQAVVVAWAVLAGLAFVLGLGWQAWQRLVPARLKARWVEGLRGGVAAVQFARSADGRLVVLVDEAILTHSATTRFSRRQVSGYDYHWLVAVDGLTGRPLRTVELDPRRAERGVEFLGGAPGRVWVHAAGAMELRDPATGEVVEGQSSLASRLGTEAAAALAAGQVAPIGATGDLALFQQGVPRWRLQISTLTVRTLDGAGRGQLLYESPSQRRDADARFDSARLPDGTRFEIEWGPAAGYSPSSKALRVTPPDGAAPRPLLLPSPRILGDQVTRQPVLVEGPAGVVVATHDPSAGIGGLVRVDATGRVVWRFSTSDLPGPALARAGLPRDAHLADGQLLVVVEDRLVSLDPATGRPLWTYGASLRGRAGSG